jgi:hypothetical protein
VKVYDGVTELMLYQEAFSQEAKCFQRILIVRIRKRFVSTLVSQQPNALNETAFSKHEGERDFLISLKDV